MKKITILIIVYILLATNSGMSQDTAAFCNLDESLTDNFFNKNGNCGTLPNGDFLFYDNIDTYIPRFDNEPLHNPPMKKIKININIFQKADGTGNFPENEETMERFRQILVWVNDRYKIGLPCDPIPGVQEIDQTNISFDMGEVGSERIYFYQDNYLWGTTSGTAIINTLQTQYPERLECLNVFIVGQPTTSYAIPPSYSNFNLNQYVVISSWYGTTHTDFAESNTLAHEFGHNLQLLHTYYGGGGSANCSNNDEYLSDVFGPWQGNCPHIGPPNIWNPDACDNTIPNADRITNNLMGGNKQNDYISPKQAGKMHRALALTTVRKYVDEDVYNEVAPLVINTDQVWDFDIKLYRDVIVEPGAELTISCKVTMPWKGKIIVKPGAELIIDGGTVTTDSKNHLWVRIEVQGDKTKHQYTIGGTCYQGKLILKNGATIEKAGYGAYMGRIDENGLPDPDKAGGIIQVIGNNSLTEPSARFINNLWGVKFLPYENYNPNDPTEKKPNRSYFNNAWFEANDDYPVPSYWYMYHVYLQGVRGVAFKGCTFTNQSSTPQGIGIACTPGGGLSTGFNVSAICTSQMYPCPDQTLDKCLFENLYKGIDVDNTGIYTFTVEDAIFNNNSYGIEMSDVNNASVLFSKFYIGNVASKDSEACGSKGSGYGISMDNCTGFAIEENEFYKATGAPTGNYTGIRIAETEASDEIYKNYFEGLSYANYTEGQNWDDNIYEGLAYICNINEGNYRDFDVEQNSIGQGGIQVYQGTEYLPAGNKFTPSGANYHFYNNGNFPVGYYYCTTCPDEYPDPVYQVIREGVSNENLCLTHYGSGGGSGEDGGRTILTNDQKLQHEQLYAQSLSDYSNVKTLYDALKDGGNTVALKTDVATAWPSEMWQLRADLLNKSPHLSMEILKATADKTDVFPDNVIFEILAANPDELKKVELIKYLENKQNPLPQYMIDILKQVATGTTSKTVLQQQMSGYNRIKTRAAHDMIRSLINDTVTNMPELRNWLDNLGGIRADHQIINTYLNEGNFTDATALASQLPDLYKLVGNDLTEHNHYMFILNLKINLQQQGRSISELTTDEVAQLNTIAENSRCAGGAEARGILEANYGYGFCDCLNVVDNQGFKSTTTDPGSLSKVYGITLNVDPNPAKEWTAFNYTLPDNTTQGIIRIVDIAGRVVEVIEVSGQEGQHIWDTRNIKPGVYMYSFTVNGIVNTDKIIIQK